MLRPTRKHGNATAASNPSVSRNHEKSNHGKTFDNTKGKSKPFRPLYVLFALTVVMAAILYIGSSEQRSNLVRSKRNSAVTSYVKLHDAQESDSPEIDSNDESKIAPHPPLQPGDALDGRYLRKEEKPLPLVAHLDDPLSRPFTAGEDKALLLTDDSTKLHVIFSTDCSSFQDWQSYLLYYSALRVKQPGYVTRIASGCSDEDTEKAQQWHDEHIATMSSRFRIHFTPHFSSVTNKDGESVGDYKYFNKPFGLRHFLEHDPLLGLDSAGNVKEEDTIIILIDPDMFLMRPITHDFSNDEDVVISPRRKENRKKKVEHGVPFAQTYGLGTQWRKFPLDYITADEHSPAKDVEQQEGFLHYPVGPPYLATARDMYAISLKWSEFAPRLHEGYPNLLAEMYAYCVAAAHLGLPHQLVDSLMVSNQGVGGEGWPMVNAIPDDEVCNVAKSVEHEKFQVPSVVHYCQRYKVGTWLWAKRKVPHDIFTCEKPIFENPLSEDILKLKHTVDHEGEKINMKENEWKHNSFVVCAMLNGVAGAMEFYKDMHCDPESVNTERSLSLT